jgi:hypothetical protein
VEVGASILSIRFSEGCSASGGEGIAPEVKLVCGAHLAMPHRVRQPKMLTLDHPDRSWSEQANRQCYIQV